MVVESYGVWKAKPIRYTYQNRHQDSMSPHLRLYFTDDEAGEGHAAINIKSGDRTESRLAYWTLSQFTHNVTEKLAALNDGFQLLAGTSEQGPSGLALDFIRSNLFRRSDGRILPQNVEGPDNDILDQLKPILDQAISADATAYIYGSHFSDGKGIHNVHMNQGNSRRWAGDNGVFQDGALVLKFEDHWEAVFVGFASQAVHTEDGHNSAGQPLPRTGYMTWANFLAPELTGGVRARDDLADSPVFIIQALVNPSGSDNQPKTAPDTVTLTNRTGQEVDFSGWRIRNKAGQAQELPSGLRIAAKCTVRVEVPHAPLSNQGGTITLLNAQGLKVHGVSYTKHVASVTKQHHIHQTSSRHNSALIVIFLSTRRDNGTSGHGEYSTSSTGLSEYAAVTMAYHSGNGESAIWRAQDIYSHAQRCKDLFVLYLNISSPYKRRVSDCQRRFLTWASFLGVFTDESASLDRRLQSYPEVKELVQLMLQVLQRNLERGIVCHALKDPTSADKVVKDDGAMYGITGAVERLHRLAMAIRQSQRTNEVERVRNFASKQKNDSFPNVIKERIQARFPEADCSIQAQLAESIIYRRYRLLYERKTKERSQPSQKETTESDAPKKMHQSSETRAQKVPFDDNPAESVDSPTVPSQRPLHNIENKPFLRVQEKSQQEDMHSVRYSNPPLTARYPDPPKVAVGETKMPCRYCLGDIEVPQTADEKQKKALWEAHLEAELKPYVCVSEECGSFSASFSTAKEWKAHMWNHRADWARYIHRIKWICPYCSDETASFPREDMLDLHLTQDHPAALDTTDLARIKVNSKVAKPRNENHCPLCGAPPWNSPGMISKEIDISSKQFNDLDTHFLAHLQHLALLSISWWDVDNGAEKTSAPGREGTIDRINQEEVLSQVRVQIDAPWGLGRISSDAKVGLNPPYAYTYKDDAAGAGTVAYVIDTGINNEHVEFEGRAAKGPIFVSDGSASDEDVNGHGTHVAGTIASRAYGVAKKANIVGVKVFSDITGLAQTSDIIKALDWVVGNVYDRGIKGRAVVNMSLGGGPSPALDGAVASTVRHGVVVCVAAGNWRHLPAEASSPAREPLAITVGASDRNDAFADFSSFGKMVDIIAPGVDILSCWIGGPAPLRATKIISGTSMATSHVTGVACCLLSDATFRGGDPVEVTSRIVLLANQGAFSGITPGIQPSPHPLFAMTAKAEPSTQAAPNMTPEYEVKLLLQPAAVLGPNKELKSTVLSTFDMLPSITKQNIQFLDTDSKDIYTAGWSARIRKTEDDNGLELTYKKRYAIVGVDIDAALTTANNDGFDAGDAKYEAQVEWCYQKQTLSISRKKKVAEFTNSEMGLPGESNSRAMLIDEAPDKFDNWQGNNWGTSMLAESRIFGPVRAKRSVGKWEGMRLYIEVWPIGKRASTEIDYLVEASFKTESRMTASAKHDSFISYLQDKGWFLCKDSLKTQLVMERY